MSGKYIIQTLQQGNVNNARCLYVCVGS